MKKRLNLDQLKVKSFITDLDNTNAETVKGGGTILSLCNGCQNKDSDYCSAEDINCPASDGFCTDNASVNYCLSEQIRCPEEIKLN